MSNMYAKKWLFCFIALLTLLALTTNFTTIKTFPSWFDEAFFANIAFNLSRGTGLVLDLIPDYFSGEVFVYGPIFFHLQASLIKFFGLSDLIFRLPNFISAYLAIIILAAVLRQTGVPRRYQLVFFVAAIVDVSINRNLVGGRMDMLAVMCVTFALYLTVTPPSNSWLNYFRWLAIGLICAFAYLTTPRALFLLPVVFVVGLWRLYENRTNALKNGNSVILILLALIAFLVPVWVWIMHAGGLKAYSLLFSGNENAAQHIAPSFFRSIYDNIAIGLMIVLSVISFRKIIKSAFLIGLVLTYIAFSLFVKEVGPYAAMIMPFVLATVITLIVDIKWPRLPRLVVIAMITIPGILLLVLRSLDVYYNSSCRDEIKVMTIADTAIQNNKNIIAPFKYYFILENSDRNLLTLEYSKVDKNSILNAADFVINSKNQSIYFESRGLHQIAQLTCHLKRIPLLPDSFYERSIFNEAMYKR